MKQSAKRPVPVLALVSLSLVLSPALAAQDQDGDGWTPADGDCSDVPTAACPFPAVVNPGALELPGNLIDDDCDGSIDEPAPVCSVGTDLSANALQLAQAMDLCETTTAAPPLPSKKWGVISASLVYADGSSAGAFSFDQQTAVMTAFGSNMLPQLGATMTVLSTGRARDKNDPGFSPPSPGTDYGHAGNPPPSYLAAHGGVLPGGGQCATCPSGTGANDSVNLRVQMRVPTNADAIRLRYRFLAVDYLNFSCSQYNDLALVLLDSAAFGIPADKNIALDGSGDELSLNAAFYDACVVKDCYTCPDGVAPLAGTGYEDLQLGAATKWLEAEAPVVPGEVITLQFMIFDSSDMQGDSTLLVDAFEWIPLDPCPTGPSSEVVRLGTPPNPNALLPGLSSGPVTGAVWDPAIDHTSFVPLALIDALAISVTPLNVPTPIGTVLCDPSPPAFVLSKLPSTSTFQAPVPGVCTLVGLQLFTQGASLAPSGALELTNALDITIGSF